MDFCDWCHIALFPGLQEGIYVEVLASETTKAWTTCLQGWMGYTTHLTAEPGVFLHFLETKDLPRYIHCAVFHDSAWIKNCLHFPYRRYRFGGLVFCIHGAKRKHQVRLRKVLGDYHYQQVAKHGGYVYYKSTLGTPPYYIGQVAYQRYRILGNLKSGCGSKGVYIVGGLQGPGRGRQDLVLKRCNTEKVFLRELEALRRTQSWPHTPSLVDFIPKELVIVTNWCGYDIRDAKKSTKRKVIPQIQALAKEVREKYKLYHNDIRWKNITRHEDRIMFVDWGMSGEISRERDSDHILNQ